MKRKSKSLIAGLITSIVIIVCLGFYNYYTEKTTIYLVRHAETEANIEGRLVGRHRLQQEQGFRQWWSG